MVIVCGKFPDSLKLESISPVYKVTDPLDKTNYRPASVLPLLSTIYERLIFDQLSWHANKVLSKLLCGFRKAHSTQHALCRLRQSWHLASQNMLAQCSWICQKLMTIPHDLLIAKLEAYGLDKTCLHLLRDYLSNRKQRTRIGSSFSDWWDIICGPQGSILGPLLFKIFIKNMLFFVSKSGMSNFPDDNTVSSCGKMLGDI